MLYSIFKPIIKLALHTYFKRIDIINREGLDERRVIFVCNHPSALFDPIMVGAHTPRPIHFLAGAEWFGGRLQSWLFRREFNMIPVFRPWLAKEGEEPPSNDEMFQACYEALRDGKRIIIFPEASSVTVPWIRSIKTGAARIKLGADAFIGEDDAVKIIPVGINYTNPHRFQTSVLMKVGDPIKFNDLLADQGLSEQQLVTKMTKRVYDAMSETVFYPENEKSFEFIRNVKKIMTGVLRDELGLNASNSAEEFDVRKQIVNAVVSFRKHHPNEVLDLETRLNAYIRWFESYGFRKYNPFEEKPAYFFLKLLGLILFLPLFILGNVFNLLPFLLAQYVYDRFFLNRVKKVDAQGELNSAFAGTMGFATGLFIYVLWYVALWVLGAHYLPTYVAIPSITVLGYLSGRFALHYFKWFVQCRKYLRWTRLKIQRPDQMGALLRTRQSLISALLELRSKQARSN